MKKAAKKTKREPKDVNELAFSIVESLTSDAPLLTDDGEERDAAAVERGRQGGKKGGKERAKRLTPEQRAEISRIAATARWKKS